MLKDRGVTWTRSTLAATDQLLFAAIKNLKIMAPYPHAFRLQSCRDLLVMNFAHDHNRPCEACYSNNPWAVPSYCIMKICYAQPTMYNVLRSSDKSTCCSPKENGLRVLHFRIEGTRREEEH